MSFHIRKRTINTPAARQQFFSFKKLEKKTGKGLLNLALTASGQRVNDLSSKESCNAHLFLIYYV
ncbi:MAG TPA: hypothetical protein PKJ80_06770, partial [Candidatus Saccharicenans sp.]|nr:hypothetical protein [Candidatus Saccharicenans sp.]